MGFVRKKNPTFLELYISRVGMERELKNERGFREKGEFCYQGMIRITIRCLPLQFSPKAREQRMGRLLHNPRLGERIDFHYPF